MRIKTKNIFNVIILVAITSCMMACISGQPGNLKLYDGPELPKESISTLILPRGFVFKSIDDKIDGFMKASINTRFRNNAYDREVYLTPGKHTIEYKFQLSRNSGHSSGSGINVFTHDDYFVTTFQSNAGKKYRFSYRILPSIDKDKLKINTFVEEQTGQETWQQLSDTSLTKTLNYRPIGLYEGIKSLKENIALDQNKKNGFVVVSAGQTGDYNFPLLLGIGRLESINNFVPIITRRLGPLVDAIYAEAQFYALELNSGPAAKNKSDKKNISKEDNNYFINIFELPPGKYTAFSLFSTTRRIKGTEKFLALVLFEEFEVKSGEMTYFGSINVDHIKDSIFKFKWEIRNNRERDIELVDTVFSNIGIIIK